MNIIELYSTLLVGALECVLFSHMLGIIIPIDSYFSEGFNPPTSLAIPSQPTGTLAESELAGHLRPRPELGKRLGWMHPQALWAKLAVRLRLGSTAKYATHIYTPSTGNGETY